MKKKLVSNFFAKAIGILGTALLVAGCTNLVDDLEGPQTTSSSSSSSSSATSTPQTFSVSGDKITIEIGATNASATTTSARTISPVTPDVYWTVFGSTKATSDDEADWASGVSSGDYSTVYFPAKTADINKKDGIPFTIGAVDGRTWYFTAYATKEAPEDLYDNVGSNGAPGTDNTKIAAKIAAVKAKAIVRGTVSFTISLDASTGIATLTNAADSTKSATTIVAADSPATGATGRAIIPVSIPKTTGVDALDDYQVIDSVVLTVGSNTYTVTGVDGEEAKFAFTPSLAAGKYSVKLQLLSASTFTQSGNKTNEIFSYTDTLTIKANYDSYVTGLSGVIGDVTYTSMFTETSTALADGATDDLIDSSAVKGYVITTELIGKYKRSTFYVTGDGGNYTAGSIKTGSKAAPFASVAEAVAAIPQIADGTAGSTDADVSDATTWTIIVDGANASTDAISITNNTDKVANVIVKAYGTSASLAAALTVQANEGKGTVRFTLQNVTVTGAVEIGTPYFFLNKSVIGGTNGVTLNKKNTVKDGTINADPADTVASATNITLEGDVGFTVVKRCTFGTDGTPSDAASGATYSTTDPTAWNTKFTLNSDYLAEEVTKAGDTSGYKYTRVLDVATDSEVTAGTAGAKGDLIVKYEQKEGTATSANANAIAVQWFGSSTKCTVSVDKAVGAELKVGDTIKFTYTIESTNATDISTIEKNFEDNNPPTTYNVYTSGSSDEPPFKGFTQLNWKKDASSSSENKLVYTEEVTIKESNIYDINENYNIKLYLTVDGETLNIDETYSFVFTE